MSSIWLLVYPPCEAQTEVHVNSGLGARTQQAQVTSGTALPGATRRGCVRCIAVLAVLATLVSAVLELLPSFVPCAS